jgi:hypothetical protein
LELQRNGRNQTECETGNRMEMKLVLSLPMVVRYELPRDWIVYDPLAT